MFSLSRHHFVFFIALVATTIVAALGVTSFQHKVAGFQRLGFELVAEQGGFRVEAVHWPETGLEVGDRIYLAQGELVRDGAELTARLRKHPRQDLEVLRGEALVPVTYIRPPLEVDVPYLLLTAIGILYLLIGLYAAFHDPRAPGRLFFLWCLTSAALGILSPVLPPAGLADRLIFLGDQTARVLLPALTLHLFLVFPATLAGVPHSRRLIPFCYLPAAVSLGLHADLAFAGGRWLFGEVTAAKLVMLDRLELLWLVLASLLAVGVLLVRLARRSSWEERRQLQLITLGMVGGYVPFLFLHAMPFALGLRWPGWLAAVATLPLALVPLAFGWAILKYKLLDIGLILRDTISYSATALVGILGFSLINLGINRGFGEELTFVRNLLSFASGLMIAGILVPIKGFISANLERLQYRGIMSQRRDLAELGRELLHERDLDLLCAKLLDRLAVGLDVERVNLYLVQGGAAVPVLLTGGELRQLGVDAFGSELWEREVESISATSLSFDLPSEQQQLFERGYRYVFPLTVRDRRVGMVLTGYRRGTIPLNSEDVDLARALLNQAALAIENAQLLEEVHRKLGEVMRLREDNQGILESSPAGIAAVDEHGIVVSANHAFAAIAGIERQLVIGRPLEQMLPIRPLPTPEDGVMAVSYCELSGRERHLQLSLAELSHVPGESGRRVLVIQDVSERVAMELALQEKERLASLGMLAAGVAHEVNTPLTGISSYAQMLLAETDSGDPRYDLLKKMERQSFRASQIVNNLLAFARNRHEELRPVRLDAVLGEVVQLFGERARTSGICISWAPPGQHLEVLGHEGELHQVFTNLTVNALDAMARRGGHLEIALESRNGLLQVRFIDDGPGIPAERLEQVFQPFFSSKINQGGTGLGLAITQNIVRRHRGEIRAENRTDGSGCIFTIELPSYQRAA